MSKPEDLSKLQGPELLARYNKAWGLTEEKSAGCSAEETSVKEELRQEVLRRFSNSHWFESINESKRSK